MSTCISWHGEYGVHVLDADYYCTRCGVHDELAQRLLAVEAERDRLAGELEYAQHEAGVYKLLHEQVDAERDRMRPVVEAAQALVDNRDQHCGNRGDQRWWGPPVERDWHLVVAIDAYRAATPPPVLAPQVQAVVDETMRDWQARRDQMRSGPEAARRTWVLPAEPGLEVTRVLDQFGQYFERQHDEHPGDDVWAGQTFAGDLDVLDLELEWPILMAYQAPLTDATPEPAEVDR